MCGIRLTYEAKRVMNGVPKEKEVTRMKIVTNAEDRKAVVKAVREFCGVDSVYLGPPTFAYQVGEYTVDREGAVHGEQDCEELKTFLTEQGVIAPEIEEMQVVLPAEGLTPGALKNLLFLLQAKQYLLNRVVGANAFQVSGKLVEALEEKQPEDMEAFWEILERFSDKNRGIQADAEKIVFTFPVQEDAKKNEALTELMANMVQFARRAKRVNPKLQMEDNEKYYLRTWLLRMGFSGQEAKEKRGALLKGLHGHTAFRTPLDEEKWKAARQSEALKQDGSQS